MTQQTTLHIALTGHRPPKLGGYNIDTPQYRALQTVLEGKIEAALQNYDQVFCHSGLALGADTIWSKAALAMNEKHPTRVFLHAEIPFLEQKDAWFKESDISFWHTQVERAVAKTIYDPEFGAFKKANANDKFKCNRRAAQYLQIRNVGMIDHADVLIAVQDPTVEKKNSGTNNAVEYAQSQNKHIEFIDPRPIFR